MKLTSDNRGRFYDWGNRCIEIDICNVNRSSPHTAEMFAGGKQESLHMINNKNQNSEHGIALFYTMLALLLMMAMAGALTFTATIETSVNSNYRQEQLAYFAAKAGLEEARARMMPTDPNSINSTITPLPTTAPTTTNHSVIYVVNPGATANSVQPWTTTASHYPDDELCHDGYVGASPNLYQTSMFTAGSIPGPGIPCTADGTKSGTVELPTGSAWYTSYTSTLPFSGSSAALPYKWVRISPKLNASANYLNLSGTPAVANYTVNSTVTYNNATLICWNNAQEVPLATTDTNCSQMLNSAGSPMTPVYVVTSLGVSPQGARKMVQAEVALTPTPPFIYGMFATSNACPAITFSGNNPSTDSFTSVGGGTYATTHTTSQGDIGSNGGVSVGNGNIGGIVGVTSSACATPLSIGSQGTMQGSVACPSGVPSACFLTAPYSFSTPVAPINVTNTTSNPNTCTTTVVNKHKTVTTAYDCLVPGTYGNISETSSLTLAPGTYNINSLSMTGNAEILVNPPGVVTLNVAGIGQSNPIAIAGNGIVDDSSANDFIINYGGTGGVSIAGNGNVTAILNAPLATVTQQGNGNWYGSIFGATISIGGNAFFHYDRNSSLAPTSNGYFTMVSYREIGY